MVGFSFPPPPSPLTLKQQQQHTNGELLRLVLRTLLHLHTEQVLAVQKQVSQKKKVSLLLFADFSLFITVIERGCFFFVGKLSQRERESWSVGIFFSISALLVGALTAFETLIIVLWVKNGPFLAPLQLRMQVAAGVEGGVE